jgi:hypothetical protein
MTQTIKSLSKKRGQGRPEIELSESQRVAAVKYVMETGFWLMRLKDFLGIDEKTLKRILKDDKDFSHLIKQANAAFLGKNIKKAKPDFILRNKARDEFADTNRIEVIDPEKELERILKLINEPDNRPI